MVSSPTAATAKLGWTDPPNVTSEQVTVYRPDCQTRLSTRNAPHTESSYVVSRLTSDTNHGFAVTVVEPTGSLTSAPVAGTTVPGLPRGLKVTARTSSSISLAGKQSPGSAPWTADIVLYERTCGVLNERDTLSSPATSATSPGLSPGAKYCFAVEAADAGGVSARKCTGSEKTGSAAAAPASLSSVPAVVARTESPSLVAARADPADRAIRTR